LLLLPAAAFAQAKNPFAADAKAIEAARGSFRIYCSPCHGIQAEGGRGPDLTMGRYSVGDEDAALFRVISEGAQGTEMPDFDLRLGSDQIWRLVAYIRSVATRSPPKLEGDRREGEKLFWAKGACGQCHRVDARGGRMGPDLTLAGRQRSLAYLRQSIVDPNAELTAGSNTVIVTLRDGRKISGVQRGFDGFSAQLLDVSDNFHSYFRSDVASIERQFRSLMPDNYGKLFAHRQVDDLLAYLVSLRGGSQP